MALSLSKGPSTCWVRCRRVRPREPSPRSPQDLSSPGVQRMYDLDVGPCGQANRFPIARLMCYEKVNNFGLSGIRVGDCMVRNRAPPIVGALPATPWFGVSTVDRASHAPTTNADASHNRWKHPHVCSRTSSVGSRKSSSLAV